MNASNTEHSTSLSNKLSHTVGNVATSGMELLAQVSFGQSILKFFDRFLWIVEKSTQWSLPPQEIIGEENGKIFGKQELVRPLPWIVFLPTLIVLRSFRFCVNVGAYLLGFAQIQPSDMVKFVQKYRRRLRTIKSNGMKTIRQHKMETNTLAKNKTSIFYPIQFTMSTIFCLGVSRKAPSPPPTRILVSATQKEKSSDGQKYDNKRKFEDTVSTESDEESEEETLLEKIDRLALEDSENDSDFTPVSETSSSSEEELEDELGEDVPDSEVQELNVEKELILKEKPETEPIQNQSTLEKTDVRPGWVISEGRENYYSPEKFELDGEATFYSPISSKSVSPERSSSPIKQGLSTGEYDAMSENVENGDVNYVDTQFVNLDKTSCSDDGTSDNVRNGRNEEKRHGKSNKGHHRNKRSNCSSRKKK